MNSKSTASTATAVAAPQNSRPRYVLRNGVTLPVDDAPAGDEMEEAATDPPAPPPALELPEPLPAEQLPRHLRALSLLLDGETEPTDRRLLLARLLDPPLTVDEAARVLGVCAATVRRHANRGTLRHQRTVGGQRRFRLSDVLVFWETQKTPSRPPRLTGEK